MTDPRYPIGKFEPPSSVDEKMRKEFIEQIESAPAKLKAAVRGLSDEQLDTPYRDGGWTVRQVVHHLPDSHLNAYIRFKLALTEDNPTIKPYDQELWANLTDSRTAPIEMSVALLESVHKRWVTLLEAMKPEDFSRTFFHPEYQEKVTLDSTLALYAWHGRHHVGQITSLRERKDWK
jgi:uncharacterized damage-inducible protein DinB